MNHSTWLRLLISGLVAFLSYSAWAYYANSLVTSNIDILIKAALVQGIYSGGITLLFTFMLEYSYKRFGASTYCLPFIVPRFNKDTNDAPCSTVKTINAGMLLSEKACKGRCLPGALLSPLPALILQTLLVTAVNYGFATPNLWLTVAPSILFSAIYGYVYSIGLMRKQR